MPVVFLLLQLVLFHIGDAVNPGCECLVFSTTYGKEYGTFSSPDYPRPYQDNINCLLYTFIASLDHIVQITFKDFDVQKSHLEVGLSLGLGEGSHLYRLKGSVLELGTLGRGYNWEGGPVPHPGGLSCYAEQGVLWWDGGRLEGIVKDEGKKRPWPYVRYHPGIYLYEKWETTENRFEDG